MATAVGWPLQKLFDEHLVAVVLLGGRLALSPRVEGVDGGSVVRTMRGRCVFLKEGRCAVHTKGKPYECRMQAHDEDPDMIAARHVDVGRAWNEPAYQKVVEDLL